MAEKKFFVDINLQGNKLVNPVVGSNSSMTAEGSFQYNAGRLEYYNGTSVQEVANLNDIAAVTGGLILQGGYDAATNTPDIAADASVLKGFFWVVTAAGSFLGEAVQVGDSIIAKQDNPGATAANWLILQGNVVIATDSVDGISRLATQAEADAGTEGGAVVITPATLQGKIDAQITPEINNKLPLTGGTLTGNLSISGGILGLDGGNINAVNNINLNSITSDSGNAININNDLNFNNSSLPTNLPAPTNGGDAANKTYVDNNTNNKLPLGGGTMSGVINMNGNNIEEADVIEANRVIVLTPVNGSDATNKDYVDNQDALKVSKAGDTMSGNLDMGGNEISNISYTETTQLGANYINTKSGETVNFIANYLDFQNQGKVSNLPAPTNGGDATNKTYVDGAASTAESNANAYTDTEVSQLSYTSEVASSAWTLVNGVYEVVVNHNLGTSFILATTTHAGYFVEFEMQKISLNELKLYSNILPTNNGATVVSIVRADGTAPL